MTTATLPTYHGWRLHIHRNGLNGWSGRAAGVSVLLAGAFETPEAVEDELRRRVDLWRERTGQMTEAELEAESARTAALALAAREALVDPSPRRG